MIVLLIVLNVIIILVGGFKFIQLSGRIDEMEAEVQINNDLNLSDRMNDQRTSGCYRCGEKLSASEYCSWPWNN